MPNPIMPRRLVCAATLSFALAGLPAGAQESAVILKDLDALEKRVARTESEIARLRKAPAPAGGRADSAVPALVSRVDVLAARLQDLEKSALKADPAESMRPAQPTPAPEAAPAASASANPGIAAPSDPLVSEVRALIAEVKSLSARLAGPASGASAPTTTQATKPAKAESSAETSPPKAAPGNTKATLSLKGDIQIQADRKLTSQGRRDNLDDFWGRLNFGAEYEGEDFQSRINLRVFPEGFGFEPLTGATFDTTGQGALKTQTTSQSRLVVNHAWVRQSLGDYRLKVGRFETVETRSDNFGNYVDLNPSGRFMSRPAVHNAVEASRENKLGSVSVLLGTNDRKLNRGFLRLYGKYAPSKKIQAGLGGKANLFDRFKFPDDEVLQRFDASLSGNLPLGWKAFAEAAVLQAAGREDDTPVLLGLLPPTGKYLDALSLEAEWMPTRKVAGKDKPFLFNAHARKALGRFRLDLGLWSDLADPDADAFAVGLRMTSGIK